MAKEPYIPSGYHNVTPSLSFRGADAAINWYKNVFGANERMRLDGHDKKIMHAELLIGDSMIFLSEESPEYKNKSAKAVNGNSVTLHLYVEDVDGVIKKAVQNGATLTMPVMDMFYGDRCGSIDDPFGYTWMLATHVKPVAESEMRRKAQEFVPEHA